MRSASTGMRYLWCWRS